MLREVVEFLKKPTSLEKVYFALFDARGLSEFEQVRAEMAAAGEFHDAPQAERK